MPLEGSYSVGATLGEVRATLVTVYKVRVANQRRVLLYENNVVSWSPALVVSTLERRLLVADFDFYVAVLAQGLGSLVLIVLLVVTDLRI